jgi:probable phosphoglycerate mutase
VRLYVARHGETDWNRAGRYQGRRESDLTELGFRQASALAGRLAEEEPPVTRILSSSLRRCLETARPLSERLGIAIEPDERLIEIAHGTWEGRLRDEIERNDAETMRKWRQDPSHVAFVDGETLSQVRGRWREFAGALRAEDTVAVFTHDVVVRLAILDAGRLPLDAFWKPAVSNGAYATLNVVDGVWSVERERTDAHLAGIAADEAAQAL